jgi:hypothetical protein
LFYPAPECLKQHAEEVLDLIIRGPTMVNIMEGEEEEEDEGCVKVAMSEDDLPEGEGSETPDDLWLEMEEEGRGKSILCQHGERGKGAQEDKKAPPPHPNMHY